MKSGDDGALHLESASRVLLKVKCEPLPVRRAELLLRGSDAWQVRLSLLPPIFDSTDAALGRGDSASSLPNGIAPTNADIENEKNNNAKARRMRDGGGDGNLWTVGSEREELFPRPHACQDGSGVGERCTTIPVLPRAEKITCENSGGRGTIPYERT